MNSNTLPIQQKLISIIIPCFNEEAVIGETIKRLKAFATNLTDLNVEFIFIDDGSRDQTTTLLRQYAAEDPRFRREVVQYRGHILPLIRLENVLPCGTSKAADQQTLQVVVHTDRDRSAGFVVGRFIDIVETALEVERTTKRDGLLGSAVIQGHVTDLVDLPAILHKEEPSFFEQPAAVA